MKVQVQDLFRIIFVSFEQIVTVFARIERGGCFMSAWLLSPEELAQCYQQDSVVVVDCRFSLADTAEGERHYRSGHIAGAHYLHLDRDLCGPKGVHGGRHPLPESAQFATALERIGVSHDTLVVAYDDNRFAFAARLWWQLRYFGHDRVKLLDGGFRAWQAQALPVETDIPKAKPGEFAVSPRVDLLVDINTVKTIPHTSGAVLIDSRENERFRGVVEPIDPIAGHINGAVNYPWLDVTDDAGYFTGIDDQQRRWQSLVSADELVVYCGSGVTACANLLSLAEIGREDAKLYGGSWSDWCSFLPEN